MIIDKDNPMESLRNFTSDSADKIMQDYSYLKAEAEYYFNEERNNKTKLLDIKKQPIGNTDKYYVFFVSGDLNHVSVADFMQWNDEIEYDQEKYLS